MDEVDSGKYPAHWYDTWDRQASQAFSTAKGLRNAPGENNCFLNSAVQVFWHIDVFRRSYRRLQGHVCMGNSCIFCALKVIFTQFQYSDQSSLPPNALRKALASTFAKQERFKLGHMDDAAECFENILRRIHFHIANNYNEDSCKAPHCISHQKFAMTVFDQLVCPCGASSEPLTFHEMVHYISANALMSQCQAMHESGDILHPDRFGLLLRNAGAAGDIRDCPGSCGKRVQIRRTLLNVPDVVSIGLVWDSDRPDVELTTEVAQSIGTTLLLPDVFHSVMCENVPKLPRMYLSALVCYYGKHYSTFVYHTKLKVWIYFDDATVKEIGPHWDSVVEKCVRGRYQPLLLLYSNPAATPICTDTAPLKRVMAPGYTVPKGNMCDAGMNISSVKNNQEEARRSGSSTPNMELNNEKNQLLNNPRALTKGQGQEFSSSGSDTDKEIVTRKSSFEHRRQSSFLIAVSGKTDKTKQGWQPKLNPVSRQNSSGEDYARNGSAKPGLSSSPRAPGGQQSGSVSSRPDISKGAIPEQGQDEPDGYNSYTLSNNDNYRRPSINVEPNKLPLTLNFSRVAEVQKKESFKKGKGKVPADVIRYQVSQSSSDSDQSSPVFPENSGSPKQGNSTHSLVANKPMHFRNRSQSYEDTVDDHPELASHPHKVIKPKPVTSPYKYENIDGLSHTPVQSGLATLPRKKNGAETHGKHGSHSGEPCRRQTSLKDGLYPSNPASSLKTFASPPLSFQEKKQEMINRQQCCKTPEPDGPLSRQNCITPDPDHHSRQSSSSSILSQNTVVEFPVNDKPESREGSVSSQSTISSQHSRQASSVSQDGQHEKNESKSKQSSKSRKEEKRTKLKNKEKKSANSSKPPLGRESKPKDEGFVDDGGGYIDSNMVESVLNFQKLQRQGSTYSNSSLESADSFFGKGRGLKEALSAETSYDTVSLESHKDSGYSGSDRNSSSSTGSITLNPYEQYFMSRSMIPPKTFNQQAMKRFMDPSTSPNGLQYTTDKDLRSLMVNPEQVCPQTLTVQHCAQIPEDSETQHLQKSQSTPTDLKFLSKEERNKQIYEALKSRPKPGMPPQVPVKPGVGTQSSNIPHQVTAPSQSQHHGQQSPSQSQVTAQSQLGNQPPPNGYSEQSQSGHNMSSQSVHRNYYPAQSQNGQQSQMSRCQNGRQAQQGCRQQNSPYPQNYPAGPEMGPGMNKQAVASHGPQDKAMPNYQESTALGTAPHVQDCVASSQGQTVYNDGVSASNQQFMDLCQKAEEFMDECVLAETTGDFSSALSSCQNAIDNLKQAMMMQSVSQQYYVYAQRKHNSCVLKSRSLQKRAMTRQESNTSTNSSDSDYRNPIHRASPQIPPSQLVRPPSRSSSQTSIDNLRDSRSSSSNNSRSGTPVMDKFPSKPSMDRFINNVDSNRTGGERTCEASASDMNNMGGTLPRRNQRPDAQMCNNRTINPEVYQSYLDRQRNTNSDSQYNSDNNLSNFVPPQANVQRTEFYQDGSEQFRTQLSQQSVWTGTAEVRQLNSANSSKPCVQQTVPKQSFSHNSGVHQPLILSQQRSHSATPGLHTSEVGKVISVPVPPVKPAWLQSGGQVSKGIVHGNHGSSNHNSSGHGNNSSSHGNMVGKVLATTASANIQTAYSATVRAAPTGQCMPVTPASLTSLSAGFSAGTARLRHIARSASFSHTKPDIQQKVVPTFPYSRQPDSQGTSCATYGTLGSKNNPSRGSQPELRMIHQSVASQPPPPSSSDSTNDQDAEDFRPSVRALASRFETSVSTGATRETRTTTCENENRSVSNDSRNSLISSDSHPSVNNVNRSTSCDNFSKGSEKDHVQKQDYKCASFPSKSTLSNYVNIKSSANSSVSAKDSAPRTQNANVKLLRQRSKSESEFLEPKPKSVLSKRKKGTGDGKKPRKSVTFSDCVALVDAGVDFGLGPDGPSLSGYVSDEEDRCDKRHPVGAYSDNEVEDDDSSTSADSPMEGSGEGACTLCHKKVAEQGKTYCSKCLCYMSQFMPSR